MDHHHEDKALRMYIETHSTVILHMDPNQIVILLRGGAVVVNIFCVKCICMLFKKVQ